MENKKLEIARQIIIAYDKELKKARAKIEELECLQKQNERFKEALDEISNPCNESDLYACPLIARRVLKDEKVGK